jgi:diguanylate cyclase (GGDEF)-like protein/PAS domain S-box-containing protein
MIEDSEDDYLLARGFLESVESAEYEIEWASTYDEGLQRLSGGRYDLCLLDYRLGDRTGLQLLSSARQKGIDLPFVMLTNEKDAELDSRALHLGAADFLCKVRIDPELLHRSVRFAVHHHRMTADLRERQQRLTQAALAARDGIWEWDFETNRVRLSEQWLEWLGDAVVAPNETPADVWLEQIHPEDRPEFETRLGDHLAGRAATFQFEYRMKSPGGEWRWMHVRGLSVNPGERRMTGFQSEITERKLLELRLERDAHHDPLTGLANRTVFLQKVNAVLSRPGMARKCAILYIDLDDFKNINEEHGHLAGDRVLVEVARRIEDSLRCNDTAARMGGDEFVALLEGVGSEEEACHVVRRMATAFQAPVRLDQGATRVTASFGIAVGATSYRLPQEWLREADAALFEAKRDGKARSAVRGEVLTLLPGPVDGSSVARGEAGAPWIGLANDVDLDERITMQPVLSLSNGRMEALRLRFDPLDGSPGGLESHWQRVAARYERWLRLGWVSPAVRVLVSTFDAGPNGLASLPGSLQDSFMVELPYRSEPSRKGTRSPKVHQALSGFVLEYDALRKLVRAQPEVVLVETRSILDCKEEDWELLQVFLQLAEDLGARVVADGLVSGEERDLIRLAGVGLAAGPLVAPWMSLDLFSAWLRPARSTQRKLG